MATLLSSSTAAGAGRGAAPETVKDMTQNEYRELRRVFSFLSNYATKQRLRRELAPRAERRDRIREFLRSPDTMKLVDETGEEVPEAAIAAELARLEEDIADSQRRIDACDAGPESERKIYARDLQHALATLGKPCEKVGSQPEPHKRN